MSEFGQYALGLPQKSLMESLNKLPDKERRAFLDELRAVGYLPPKNEGFFTELGQAAGQAVLRTGRGVGSTLKEFGGGDGVYEYFDDAMQSRRHWEDPDDYTPLSLNPGNLGRSLGSLAQTALIAPAAVAGGVVAGPIGAGLAGGGAVFAHLFGDNLNEYRERLAPLGYSDGEIRAIAVARTVVDSMIEVGLGTVPLAGKMIRRALPGGGRTLNAAAKDAIAQSALRQAVGKFGKDRTTHVLAEIGKGAGKGAAGEGFEEVWQKFNGYAWRAVFGDAEDAPEFKDYAEAFAGGAIPGALLGGVSGLTETRGDAQRPDPETAPSRSAWSKHFSVKEDQGKAAEFAAAASALEIGENEIRLAEPVSRAAKAMDGIAGELGLKVEYFVPSTENAQRLNGLTAPDGTLYLDAAGMNQNPMKTLGHEFLHYLEKNEPFADLADGWRQVIAESMTEAGIQETAELAEQYGELGDAASEFNADRFGEMFTDPDFWRRTITLAEAKQAGFGAKLLAALDRFIAAVKRNFLKINSPEAGKLLDDLEKVREQAAEITAEFKKRNAGMIEPAAPPAEAADFSLTRKPESIADYLDMPGTPRPPRLRVNSLKELYDSYRRDYLGQTIETPSGHRMTFKPGHFFRLIAGTPEDGRKGLIAKAGNAAEAIRMIESGKADFQDIAGYQPARAEYLGVFKDILQDPDFWYQDGHTLTFGKKFDGMKRADGFLAVTLQLDGQGNIGPLSFHQRRMGSELLKRDNVHWNVKNGRLATNSAADKPATGETAETQSGDVNPIIAEETPDVKPEESEKSDFSLARRQQVNPIREEGPARRDYQKLLDNRVTERRADAEVMEQARRRIDGYGGVQGMLQAIADGEYAFGNDVSMKVGHLILNSPEYKQAMAENDPAVQTVADGFVRANSEMLKKEFAAAGTEAGRALRARRLGSLDLGELSSIQAHLNALLGKIKSPEQRRKTVEKVKRQTGVDPENVPDNLAGNDKKLDEVVRTIRSANAGLFDKAYEYWINAILSAPTTHMANLSGNTAMSLLELGPQRLVEAAINTVARKPDAATFGEFREMWRQFARQFAPAMGRARLAFDLEAVTSEGKLEYQAGAVGGTAGRIIRIPGRALRAADEFAKALIGPIEAAAFAYRRGKAQKLSGDDLTRYVTAQVADPNSRARKFGHNRARELTFQREPGRLVRGLMNLREIPGPAGMILKFILPFIKTPANILITTVRKGPLGTVNLAKEGVDVLRGKRKIDDEMIRHAAEQLLVWSVLLAVWHLLMSGDDDEPPRITGTAASYGSSEGAFKNQKIPPYSIRIGDTYYSYKRIEPFASILALMADSVNAIQDARNGKEMSRVISGLIANTAKQMVSEKSFLDGIGSIVDFFDDPERNVAKEAGNYLASWVPNAVRSTMNAFQDHQLDYKNRSRGAEWWKDQFRIAAARAGIPGMVIPKIDYFGREIAKDDFSGGPGAYGVMWRIAAPVYRKEADSMDAAEKLLWRFNVRNPDEAYWPGIPSYISSSKGKTHYLDSEDYAEYAKGSGRLAHRLILAGIKSGQLNVDNPDKNDIEEIKKIFAKARKQVRDQFKEQGKYHE